MKEIQGTADCDFNPLVASRIAHTPGLENALIRMMGAVDGNGLKVHLANGLNPRSVADELIRLSFNFFSGEVTVLNGNKVPTPDESRRAALAAINNVILLAEALREHIHAGNYPL